MKFMCVYYCTVKQRKKSEGKGERKGENAYCKLLCNTALHSNARKNAFGNVVVFGRGWAINSKSTDDMKTLILCIKIVLNSFHDFIFLFHAR